MGRTLAKASLYKRRRSAGQCVQCGVDAGGKSKCAACAEAAKASRRQCVDRRKLSGLCTSCGSPAKSGCAQCQVCISKTSAVSSKRYRENRAAGVCPYCGEDTGGAYMCDKCRATHKRGTLAWYHRQVAAGRCVRCGDVRDRAGSLCWSCAAKNAKTAKLWHAQLRDKVFAAYGGYTCVHCGHDDPDAMQLDHIDGGGKKHIEEIGGQLYRWLLKHDFPSGFQVLCANCNMKKAKHDVVQAASKRWVSKSG